MSEAKASREAVGRRTCQEDVGSLPVEAVVEADLKVRPVAAATRALAIPLAFTLALASFVFLDSVRDNVVLWRSFMGAVAVLLAWNAALAVSAVRSGRVLAASVVL